MWIDRLTIENYRGISKMELEAKPINVFVGRNNTGKSSVLEAITLAATSPTGYGDALGQNLLGPILQKSMDGLYIIRIGNEKGVIRIDTKGSKYFQVEFHYLETGLPKEYLETCEDLIDRIAEEMAERDFRYRRSRRFDYERLLQEEIDKTTRTIINYPKLVIVAISGEISKSSTKSLIILSKTFGPIREDRVLPSSLFFVGTGYKPRTIDLYNRALQLGMLSPLLQTLRKEIQYFEDLRTISDVLYVSMTGLERPLPIAMIGDGFEALLKTAMVSTVARGGTLVLEEPETNLHPGFMEITTSYLVKNASESETQMFISTHSMEFLESLLEKGPELTQVVRMYLIKGEIDYEVLSGDEALHERKELLMDLRGA
ncbi:MAG: AAA family ATPase [Candidatus Caldarchaeum sp.]|nr:AAA family ATPase [Candidatus Caldarchaeum sp.]